MTVQESASVWQRVEMIGGATEEIHRLVGRLGTNLHIGHDGPTEANSPSTPRRSGIDGYLEDTFDELSGIRDELQAALQFIGQSGEGPRGELTSAKPETAVKVGRW